MTRKLMFVSFTLLGLTATMSWAQDDDFGPPPEGQRDVGQRGDRGDGRAAWRQRLIQRYDADGDGELGEAERREMRRDWNQRRTLMRVPLPDTQRDALRAEADTDGDGELSRSERRAIRDRYMQVVRTHHQTLIKRYDLDADGKLSEEEMDKLREDQRHKRFAELDADGDGQLTYEEWKVGQVDADDAEDDRD